MESIRSVRDLLSALNEVKAQLRAKGVIRSERITGDIGEWLAETAYGGKRAKSATQKGWDIEVRSSETCQRLQVRSHAKSKGNNARWTDIKPDSVELFDRLIIVVLSDDYRVEEWYDIPRESLRRLLVQSGKAWVVKWDDAKRHMLAIGDLPNASAIQSFNAQSVASAAFFHQT
jgi:hypothetical protein